MEKDKKLRSICDPQQRIGGMELECHFEKSERG